MFGGASCFNFTVVEYAIREEEMDSFVLIIMLPYVECI